MDVKIVKGAGAKKTYVVEGATLGCTLGSSTSKLKILPKRMIFLKGKKRANVKDFKQSVHIQTFGSCLRSSPPPACSPLIAREWLNGKENVTLEDADALLNSSRLACSCGGSISVRNDGQGPPTPPKGLKQVTVTMPDGTTQTAVLVNGVTVMPDGSWPPEGAVVHTAGGAFKMTDGSGVLEAAAAALNSAKQGAGAAAAERIAAENALSEGAEQLEADQAQGVAMFTSVVESPLYMTGNTQQTDAFPASVFPAVASRSRGWPMNPDTAVNEYHCLFKKDGRIMYETGPDADSGQLTASKNGKTKNGKKYEIKTFYEQGYRYVRELQPEITPAHQVGRLRTGGKTTHHLEYRCIPIKIQAFDQNNNKIGEIDGYMDGTKMIAMSPDALQNLINPQILSSKTYTPVSPDIKLNNVDIEEACGKDYLITRGNGIVTLMLKYVTAEQLIAIGWGREVVTPQMVDKLNRVLEAYNITSVNGIRHFISQVSHESSCGSALIEKHNGDPEIYFRRVVGGAKYRGAGYIQLTHKSTYQEFADYVGDQEIYNQGYIYVAQYYAWEAAGWFWAIYKKGLKTKADNGASVEEVTKIVNGWTTGLKERKDYYEKAVQVIKE